MKLHIYTDGADYFHDFQINWLTPCGSITHRVTQPSVLSTSAYTSVCSSHTLFPQGTTYMSEAWGLSVKASGAAPVWGRIILVGEWSSPDSRLCPDVLFWQPLRESNPEKHPVSVRVTSWYTELATLPGNSLKTRKEVVLIEDRITAIFSWNPGQYPFSRAVNPF